MEKKDGSRKRRVSVLGGAFPKSATSAQRSFIQRAANVCCEPRADTLMMSKTPLLRAIFGQLRYLTKQMLAVETRILPGILAA